MTAYHSPAQLFAQVQQQNTSPSQTSDVQNRSSGNQHQQRLLVFRETGYAFSTPDRIKCVLLCSSTKKKAEEAKLSTDRRLDYIKQTLRNNSLKEGQHYHVHSLLSTVEDNQYRMMSEVSVTFFKTDVYERVVSLLVEKLAANIQVSEAVFYVSPEKRSDLRRQACLDAVRNCRTKALSVAQYMNQTLGSALTVREENTTEMVGNSPTQEPNAAQSKLIYQQSHHNHLSNDGVGMDTTKTNMVPIHQRIADATVSVYVNVYVEFEVTERTRKVTSTK